MEFSLEQQHAFNKYQEGQNIFLTGPGGSGKSALIKHIFADAVKQGKKIQVCALTGCAAVLLECKAKTIHSWAGIGKGLGGNVIDKVKRNKYARTAWKEIEVLILDEVSMMSKHLFELLDAVGKVVRRCSRPFGGIQLIFSGDFYQLPPVGQKELPDTCAFCFESTLWFITFAMENHVQLLKMFRQTDPLYISILTQIRQGRIKRSTNEFLMAHVGKSIELETSVKPTKLFPMKYQVEEVNQKEMNALENVETIYYEIKDSIDLTMNSSEKVLRLQFTKDQIKAELSHMRNVIPCGSEPVKLKLGAQVMCIVNIVLEEMNDTLCNGAQGIVIGFSKNDLKLPIVRYTNGYVMTMEYNTWKSENIPGIGVSQIPLILAWAITIHKSQGTTLEVAEIDAGSGIFECGQTYVALSRVKTLSGLYLSSFDISRVKINKKVQDFYSIISL